MNEQKKDEVVIKKKKKWLIPSIILLLILAFMFIVVAIVATVIIVSVSNNNKLQEQLDLGQKYISELNYDQAIVAYEEAININPKSADAYIGLADTYVAMGDYTGALNVLQEGYKKTADARIIERVEAINAILNSQGVYDYTNQNGSEIVWEEVSANIEVDLNALYEQQLQALEDEYGYFDNTQKGYVYDNGTAWLNTSGILGYEILDLDSDGTDELLVCVSEVLQGEENGTVYIKVYEPDSTYSTVLCKSSMHFLAHSSGVLNRQIISRERSNMMMTMNIICVDNKYYIMCEQHRASNMEDNQNYWLLEYRDDMLQYVCSFTQTVGVGNEYEHTAYKFDGWNVVDTQIYTRDSRDEESLKSALVSFFDYYGINIEKESRYTSILTDENNVIAIFYFKYSVGFAENEYDVFLENGVMMEDGEYEYIFD